ncbi:MAG: ABC transporter substrate-binding protein [Desulfovibrio sp.]|nr:ABC transporter substrate-binding protein [Desulfovibrio sp.]
MNSCRFFVAPVRMLMQLALLGCLAACSLPLGLGQQSPSKTPSKTTPSGPCVVLALPSSGHYAAISGKIGKGARMALTEMALNGTKMRLETVDTDASDWLQKLDALPEECVVVGGPLQGRTFAQVRSTASVDKRAFFAFVPSLEHNDEGSLAWRFFPSPRDQVEALVNFATDGLNIRSYGAFYPDDAYGTRMTALLEQNLSARNMILQKASYNPADKTSWSSAVAPLINPQMPEGSRTPVPQTSFEAIFLPDSWKNLQMLISSLLYNGEDRLVLLGTTLWEQGLSGKSVPQAEKYALAVFPGAWNPDQAPKALRVPGTDFWVALGYDFARFGVSMALRSRPDSRHVTVAAQRASRMLWGMAPISWDDSGVAHQKLFVFGITSSGMSPASATDLQQTRERVMQQAALRMQGLPPEDETGHELAVPPEESGSVPQSVPTPQEQLLPMPQSPTPAPTPVIGTTPRPSYKLRLPNAQ